MFRCHVTDIIPKDGFSDSERTEIPKDGFSDSERTEIPKDGFFGLGEDGDSERWFFGLGEDGDSERWFFGLGEDGGVEVFKNLVVDFLFDNYIILPLYARTENKCFVLKLRYWNGVPINTNSSTIFI
ncbi:hypothetical protein AVEN_77667-1 [Araneus ventricosus]|uniref:Uncharacterized protein n=1 Tax=Araneus ventricosus TaxID=182803 RepID=A0A4Y2PF65_ARAVE|nr:hypothetical protein AVEN_77667-1 [Araneus ventricosus]